MRRRGGIRRRRLRTKPSCGPERLTAGECRGRGRPTCGATGSRERSSAMWGTWVGPAISRLLRVRRNLICQGWGWLALCVPARVARYRRDDRHPWRGAVPAGRRREKEECHALCMRGLSCLGSAGLSSCFSSHVSFSFTSPRERDRDRDAIAPLSCLCKSFRHGVEAGKLPAGQGSPCMFGLGK